jgi:hypothetical protein
MKKAHAQLRRSQVVGTYGPGALIDLPRYSAIMAGLESWGPTKNLTEVQEPRLAARLAILCQSATPKLYLPPDDAGDGLGEARRGVGAYLFPEWFLVQEDDGAPGADTAFGPRARRLVHRSMLDESRRTYQKRSVVATRFVVACPRGHVQDLDWHFFLHGGDVGCTRATPKWLIERGTSGDLGDIVARCDCGRERSLFDATERERNALGSCHGEMPWLGRGDDGRVLREDCGMPARLLIRSASNAYFAQTLSVLALPEATSSIDSVIEAHWKDLAFADDEGDVRSWRKNPVHAAAAEGFDNAALLAAIEKRRNGASDERPIKLVELDALTAAPEGYGEDMPINPDFHARRLPRHVWAHGRDGVDVAAGIASVVQVHRLREVTAQFGFTRFEAQTPGILGEYDGDVTAAPLAREVSWLPAIENRGEGIFLEFRSEAVQEWADRDAVKERLSGLERGHAQWAVVRSSKRPFPGGPYILLHTLSHLLLQTLAVQCGYPASSIRERIYSDENAKRYGILLYTGTPDAEGTLGGLVQQARHIESHLERALRSAALCSNDPICAHHEPGDALEGRWLHGAACHGCSLVAETSCENRNDYLDRALVVPALGVPSAAFFPGIV